MVASNVWLCPSSKVSWVLLRVIPETATVTVTLHCATKPPSSVVAVIVQTPAALHETSPLELTVATVSLLDVHLMAGFVALDGETVAVNVNASPTRASIVSLSKVMPVTG